MSARLNYIRFVKTHIALASSFMTRSETVKESSAVTRFPAATTPHGCRVGKDTWIVIMSRYHILLIVPSATERTAIGQILQNDLGQPFRCTETTTAANGLHHWRQGQTTDDAIDLILLDWRLPDMDIGSFLHTLQGTAALLPLPVIVVSNQESELAAQGTLAVGVQDVITKAQALSSELPRLLTKALTRFQVVQQLHTNAVHFQTLATTAPAMIWATGEDDLPLFFNAAWLAFTGSTVAEALRTGWTAGIHPDDYEHCWRIYTHARAQLQSFELHYRRRQYTGEYCWLLDRAAPRLAKDGAFLGYTGSCFDITARKQAQDALQANETKYRSLFESTMDAIFIGAADGTYVDVNPAAAQLLGLPREQIIGVHYSTFIPEEWFAYSREVAKAIRATGSWSGEFPMRRGDGTIVWTEYHSHFDGQQILGVARNVTERKQAELSLQAAHTRIQNILESITDAFYTLDQEWRFTYINPSAERYFGRPKADLLGRCLWAVFPGAVGSLFEVQYRRAMTERIAVHFEALSPVIRRWVEARAYPSPDGLTIYFQDVTSRREAEAVLVARTRQQAAVAVLGQWALEILDVQMLMEKAVQTVAETLEVEYCKLLERLPDGESLLLRAGVGWRAGCVGHTIINAGEHSQAGYALTRSAPVIVTDLRTETRFHSPALLHEHGVISGITCLITDRPAQPYGVIGAHTATLRTFTEDDVNFLQAVANVLSHALQRQRVETTLRNLNATLEQRVQERTAELEQSNRELARSNSELDHFAYVASHDLQAPLRGIDQLASWITEDAAAVLSEPSKLHLTKLRGRITRMERLLNDLLAYARASRQRHTPEWVNTTQLVQEIVDLLAPPPGMTVDIQEPLPLLRTERTPLETVLRNLVGNAIKHHHQPHTGRLRVTAEKQEAWITFCISDNGPGIDPRFHGRIFQLFQTLHPRDQVEGSGLGLAIVRRLVENRGGSISLASDSGQGATFSFTWPSE